MKPAPTPTLPAKDRTRPLRVPRKRRAFLAVPYGTAGVMRDGLRAIIESALAAAGYGAFSLDSAAYEAVPFRDVIVGAIAEADCVIAELSERNPNVFFELGVAQAMGKPCVLLVERARIAEVPADLRGLMLLTYDTADATSGTLHSALLAAIKRPGAAVSERASAAARAALPFFVDWEALEPRDIENLVLELLTQLGFRKSRWHHRSPFTDFVTEVPRKDPDGYEYREIWLVSIARTGRMPEVLRMPPDPDFLMHIISQDEPSLARGLQDGAGENPMSILLVTTSEDAESAEELRGWAKRFRSRRSTGVRVRIWDRHYLTSLVQQYPQVGYKYFSPEVRSRAKYRQTPEELYREKARLALELEQLNKTLVSEREARIRLERDLVWKDVAFAAAHKLGNPIFAIEASLDPLKRRLLDGRREEADAIVGRIEGCVERAKQIVGQFKSLSSTSALAIQSVSVLPLLEAAAGPARDRGHQVSVVCPSDLRIMVDVDRVAECIEELVMNALAWVPPRGGSLALCAARLPGSGSPDGTKGIGEFCAIRVEDNGPGVPVDRKAAIFNAFVTSRTHGTGLGLAIVRVLAERHGGYVREVGTQPGGAIFELCLPADPSILTDSQASQTPGVTDA